jgi:hypothetical protein
LPPQAILLFLLSRYRVQLSDSVINFMGCGPRGGASAGLVRFPAVHNKPTL